MSDDALKANQNGARTVLGIDPGRSKCGIAVVRHPPFQSLARQVVATERLVLAIGDLQRAYPEIERIVIGNGTQSAVLGKAVAQMFPQIPISVVDEHGSSQRARSAFLAENPARGWKKLLPQGLRTPDRPYDDLVAEILIKDFMET